MQHHSQFISELFEPPSAIDLQITTAARKFAGDSADESDDLARQSLNDGDYEAAIAHFKRAVEQREPSNIHSRIDLAGAYDCTDEYPQALRQYLLALRACSEASEPHVGVSDLYKRHGRFKDSIQELEEAIRKEPSNAYYHLKLAETLRDAGCPQRALTAAQGAVAAQPDSSFYHYWIGDLLMSLARYPEALDSLRAAIELSPGDDHLYLRATVAFWRAGRKSGALNALKLAQELNPKSLLYHGLLEILLRDQGQTAEADRERVNSSTMDRYDRDCLRRLEFELGLS